MIDEMRHAHVEARLRMMDMMMQYILDELIDVLGVIEMMEGGVVDEHEEDDDRLIDVGADDR